MAIFHDPRLEPGFELPTDARGCLCFGQEGRMIDAVEAFRDVNFQRVLRPKPDAVEDGFDGIPAGTSWAKAIGMRRQLGFPFGFQGLAHERLPCPVLLGRNPERALFRAAPLRNPGASQRRGLAIETEGVGKGQRCGGVRDFTPSIPAVCFPRLSWVTRRTASSRAYHDLTSNFCSLRAVLTCPCCVAR